MRKIFMCAFLALSLAGGQLSAYSMEDELTPSRLGCMMLSLGVTKEEAKSQIEEVKKTGLKSPKGVQYNYKSTLGYERFYNDAGEKAKFKDLDGLNERKHEAIAGSDDKCAYAFFAS